MLFLVYNLSTSLNGFLLMLAFIKLSIIFIRKKKIRKPKNYVLTKIGFGSFLLIFTSRVRIRRSEKMQTFPMANFDP